MKITIETKYNIGDDVYFINNDKIKKAKITEIKILNKVNRGKSFFNDFLNFKIFKLSDVSVASSVEYDIETYNEYVESCGKKYINGIEEYKLKSSLEEFTKG